jgi:hypothetical protein
MGEPELRVAAIALPRPRALVQREFLELRQRRLPQWRRLEDGEPFLKTE